MLCTFYSFIFIASNSAKIVHLLHSLLTFMFAHIIGNVVSYML